MMKYFKVASVLAAAAGAVRPAEEDCELGVHGNESAAEKINLNPNHYIARWQTRDLEDDDLEDDDLDLAIPLKCKDTGLYLRVGNQLTQQGLEDDSEPQSGAGEPHCVLVTCQVSGGITTEKYECPSRKPKRFVSLTDAFTWTWKGPSTFELDRSGTVLSGTWDDELGGLLVNPAGMYGSFQTTGLSDNSWSRAVDPFVCKTLLSRPPTELDLPYDGSLLKAVCITGGYMGRPAFAWKCDEFTEKMWVSTTRKNGFDSCRTWEQNVDCKAHAGTPQTRSAPAPMFGGVLGATPQYLCEQELNAEVQSVLHHCLFYEDHLSKISDFGKCTLQDFLPK